MSKIVKDEVEQVNSVGVKTNVKNGKRDSKIKSDKINVKGAVKMNETTNATVDTGVLPSDVNVKDKAVKKEEPDYVEGRLQKCHRCGKKFFISDENVQWYVDHKMVPPLHCRKCRVERRLEAKAKAEFENKNSNPIPDHKNVEDSVV